MVRQTKGCAGVNLNRKREGIFVECALFFNYKYSNSYEKSCKLVPIGLTKIKKHENQNIIGINHGRIIFCLQTKNRWND